MRAVSNKSLTLYLQAVVKFFRSDYFKVQWVMLLVLSITISVMEWKRIFKEF